MKATNIVVILCLQIQWLVLGCIQILFIHVMVNYYELNITSQSYIFFSYIFIICEYP